MDCLNGPVGLPLVHQHRHLDLAGGDHIDVDAGREQCLKHLARHAGVVGHARAHDGHLGHLGADLDGLAADGFLVLLHHLPGGHGVALGHGKADIFAAGDKVDATAITKGKGFQGAIKRLGQHRGPMAHGSKFHRHQGSNGACSSPSRVFKGKGMPGHMGHVKATVQNLEIVRVDAENNLLLIKGAVPGPKKSLVTIKESVKAAK